MIDARTTFERCHIRCTKQRAEVYETLSACTCHPTAEQLHRMVCERSPGTSLATVYNTLEALTDAGLCRRIATAGGARYDADLSHHLHTITPDGRVMDVPPEAGQEILSLIPPEAVERIEAKLGVRVRHIEIQLQLEPEEMLAAVGVG